MVSEIDINRRLLSIAINCYRLSVYRLTTPGDQKAYWVPLSVQNHSRSCFHVDFVQCDSCLEIIYDMLNWPCEKKLRFEALRRCEQFVWKPSGVCLLVGVTQWSLKRSFQVTFQSCQLIIYSSVKTPVKIASKKASKQNIKNPSPFQMKY